MNSPLQSLYLCLIPTYHCDCGYHSANKMPCAHMVYAASRMGANILDILDEHDTLVRPRSSAAASLSVHL